MENTKYDKIVIVIPALEPDERMIKLIMELREKDLHKIIVVDDGSGEKYQHFFKTVEVQYACQVFRHYKNYGKGRALKNAFNFALTRYNDIIGVITVDSDGQHLTEDIIKCADALLFSDEKKKIFLGARDFNNSNVPARSLFGNKVTSYVLKWFAGGMKISDTQTGLRGITKSALEEILALPGERYEYEMNMLIEAGEKEIALEEIPIHTIYIDENASSHFRPIVDSLRIYRQFLKYMLVSLSSFVLDFCLFYILSKFLKIYKVSYYLIWATYGARIVSSVWNFSLNHIKVFKSRETIKKTAIRYFLLCFLQGSISAIGVHFLYICLHCSEVVGKIIVDTVLFFISFFVQKNIIFKG